MRDAACIVDAAAVAVRWLWRQSKGPRFKPLHAGAWAQSGRESEWKFPLLARS